MSGSHKSWNFVKHGSKISSDEHTSVLKKSDQDWLKKLKELYSKILLSSVATS
jgi:hypothetical protein